MSAPGTSGPTSFQAPLLDGSQQVWVDGQETGVELTDYASETDDQGVVVTASTGEHVPHVQTAIPAAPLTIYRTEIEFSWQQVAEGARERMMIIPGLSRLGLLEIYLDVTTVDLWIGDGVRTTFTMSKRTAYGTTQLAFAARPARCRVTTAGVEVELIAVEGSPSPGEFQLSQTTDSKVIVLGSAPGEFARAALTYYPLWKATEATYSEDTDERNNWQGSVSFRSFTEMGVF